MKSITLKNVPLELHQAYKERARRNARSLNREILQTLETAAFEQAPDIQAVITRTRQRVARQVTRRQAAGKRQLTNADYLEAIQEGRE